MILLNFSHPLTPAHLEQLAQALGEPVPPPRDHLPQFDHGQPFAEQVTALVEGVGLSPAEWQTARILINPPGHSLIAAALLAELHGRMGYFPTFIRLRPVPGRTPPEFEVAELMNLQAMRDHAREMGRD